MKAKNLFLLLAILMSTSYSKGQSYVFGFSNNTIKSFQEGFRTDYYNDMGYGGNEFVWSIQNGSAYGFDLSPIVSVDFSQLSYSVISVPGGGITTDVCSMPISFRKQPFYWQFNCIFQWDQYAELVKRDVYIAYGANDWDPDDYTSDWRKKKVETKKLSK